MINPRAKCKIIDKHDPVNDEIKKIKTLVTTQSFLLSIVSPINISLAAGDNSKKKEATSYDRKSNFAVPTI